MAQSKTGGIRVWMRELGRWCCHTPQHVKLLAWVSYLLNELFGISNCFIGK